MRQVRVVGVALDTSDQHVILLGPAEIEGDGGPLMPIWVGPQEASSILMGSGGLVAPRPLTHDLFSSLIDSLNVELINVEITSLDDGTFYAVINLRSEEREHILDARPSDAIGIAVRTGSPIFVDENVFETAAVSSLFADHAEDFEEFKEFLDKVNPEDFESDKN